MNEKMKMNILVLIILPSYLGGPSGIRAEWSIEDQCQTRGQKAPCFGWATFRWASCIDNIA